MRIEGMDATIKIHEPAATGNLAAPVKFPSENTSKEINTQSQQDDTLKVPLSEKTVISTIERANKVLKGASTQLEFSVHELTKEIMVKVINTDTKEVVREIPSEKILDMVYNLMQMAGIFVDEKK